MTDAEHAAQRIRAWLDARGSLPPGEDDTMRWICITHAPASTRQPSLASDDLRALLAERDHLRQQSAARLQLLEELTTDAERCADQNDQLREVALDLIRALTAAGLTARRLKYEDIHALEAARITAKRAMRLPPYDRAEPQQPPGDAQDATQPPDATPAAHESHTSSPGPHEPAPDAQP